MWYVICQLIIISELYICINIQRSGKKSETTYKVMVWYLYQYIFSINVNVIFWLQVSFTRFVGSMLFCLGEQMGNVEWQTKNKELMKLWSSLVTVSDFLPLHGVKVNFVKSHKMAPWAKWKQMSTKEMSNFDNYPPK